MGDDMLDALAELAKKPIDPPAKKDVSGKIEAPEWWTKLTPAGRDTYLRNHPKSLLTSFIKQELNERLKTHPKERAKLRGVVKDISKNPAEALAPDFKKLEDAADKPVSQHDQDIVDDAIAKSRKPGKSRSILKGALTCLAIAGALTLGGALLASGGLPYAIITISMIKNTVELAKDVQTRIQNGEHSVKAMMSAIGSTIHRTARDPMIIASALVIEQQKRKKLEERQSKMEADRAKDEQAKNKKGYNPKVQSVPKSKQKAKLDMTDEEQQDEGDINGKHDSNKIKL